MTNAKVSPTYFHLNSRYHVCNTESNILFKNKYTLNGRGGTLVRWHLHNTQKKPTDSLTFSRLNLPGQYRTGINATGLAWVYRGKQAPLVQVIDVKSMTATDFSSELVRRHSFVTDEMQMSCKLWSDRGQGLGARLTPLG